MLSDEKMQEYIHQFFANQVNGDEAKAKNLLSFLETSTAALKAIFNHQPLLHLLCQAWLAGIIPNPKKATLAVLLEHILLIRCLNYLQDKQVMKASAFHTTLIYQHCQQELLYLELLALHQLINPAIVKQYLSLECWSEKVEREQLTLGLISHDASQQEPQCRYQFIHPILQQYFLARFIIRLFNNKMEISCSVQNDRQAAILALCRAVHQLAQQEPYSCLTDFIRDFAYICKANIPPEFEISSVLISQLSQKGYRFEITYVNHQLVIKYEKINAGRRELALMIQDLSNHLKQALKAYFPELILVEDPNDYIISVSVENDLIAKKVVSWLKTAYSKLSSATERTGLCFFSATPLQHDLPVDGKNQCTFQ